MKETILRNRVGILIIVIHFTVLIYLLILRSISWLDDEEFKISLPIIIPTFAVYTTAVIKYITANPFKKANNDKEFTSIFAFTSFLVPVLFWIALFFCISIQFIKHLPISDYASLIGLVESGFSVYIGYFIKVLFTKKG